LDESISLVEKLAKKLLPIFFELQKRAVQFKRQQENSLDFDEEAAESSDCERIDTDGDIGLEINKSRDRVNIASILKRRSISGAGPSKN